MVEDCTGGGSRQGGGPSGGDLWAQIRMRGMAWEGQSFLNLSNAKLWSIISIFVARMLIELKRISIIMTQLGVPDRSRSRESRRRDRTWGRLPLHCTVALCTRLTSPPLRTRETNARTEMGFRTRVLPSAVETGVYLCSRGERVCPGSAVHAQRCNHRASG